MYVPKGAVDTCKNWGGLRYIQEEGAAIQIQYKVTHELRYVTANIPEKIDKGMPLSFVMSAYSGYVLPDDIAIPMEGKMLEPSADYMYDPSGQVTMLSVSDDVHSCATVGIKQPAWVHVTYQLQHLTMVAAEEIINNEQFTFALTPAAGDELPEEITVVIENKTLNENTDYLYNSQTGGTTVPDRV